MPRPGARVTLVNSGLVVLTALRFSVTIFVPPISVGAWALPAATRATAINTGRAIASGPIMRTNAFISLHPCCSIGFSGYGSGPDRISRLVETYSKGAAILRYCGAKMLVALLTEKDMCDRREKKLAGGRVPPENEFMCAIVSEELRSQLTAARVAASREQRAGRAGPINLAAGDSTAPFMLDRVERLPHDVSDPEDQMAPESAASVYNALTINDICGASGRAS
jgi:hypothetical protein